MRDRMVTKVLSVIMMMVLPASIMMADTNAAMLYASGHAMLNGAGVAHSSAMFVGDKVQTAQDSAATINVSGSTVIVPADSLVQFKGDAIDVETGSAVISTSKGFKATVGALTVSPVKGTAKYQVTTKDGNVLIAARSGALSLTDANGTTTLQEGNTTTTSSNGNKKKGGAVPAVGTSTTATVGGDKAALAILAGLAAAAAATALALTTTGTPSPVSPGQP